MSDEFRLRVYQDLQREHPGINWYVVSWVLDHLAESEHVRAEWALALQEGLQLPMYQARSVQETLRGRPISQLFDASGSAA